ncbi:MAG: hypothetical protein HYY86_02310 [Candidatus Harrisonbacteria bacterium]|nr:hypothetical protein [Candidatus Harrisonbacteria bacterium]
MNSQFFGLMLLILAVAVGVYVSTNYTDLINLKIPVPVTVKPVTIPATGIGGAPSISPAPVDSGSSVLAERKLVRITSIRQPTSFNSYLEVVLSSSLDRNETLNITGWTIKSNKGSFVIPRAQEIYSFGGAQNNINLRYGDRVSLYSGIGPKGNFRLNKCLGYLEDVSPFTPSLPRSCPYISRSEIIGFSGACQNYVLSLRSCQNPVANPPVPVDDSACHNFLSKLNYVGCVEKYQNDSDFLDNEWRVWLGEQINIFDSLHDKVQLLDREGNLVDEYVY